LAVVSVPLEDIKESTLQSIKVATLGDSDTVQLGEKVVAIGNALGYGQSVTVGYISATNREVSVTSGTSQNTMTLLQTDAAINPGNSGGALLNMNGEVIGINSVKYADTSVEGMGYAIPISSATPIINELMNYEKLTDDEKGYLGITGTDITEENNLYNMPTGVYVYELATGGAAEKGGMQKGDIITAINGNAVTNMEAVKQKVNNTRVGTEITVTVMRNENGEYIEKELTITLQGKDSLNSLTTEENNTSQSQQQTTPYTEEEEDEYDFGNGLLDDFLRRFGY
jgi:serine protease Do